MRKYLSIFVYSCAVFLGINAYSFVPSKIQITHDLLMQKLNSDQIKALSIVYPDFRLLSITQGSFSGSAKDEVILGVWKPSASNDWWKREVHRVGMIKKGNGWSVHIIDDEIEKDEDKSYSFPMHWQYTLDENGFKGDLKYGKESEIIKDQDLSLSRGEKPLFNMKKAGLSNNDVVCFSTHDTYNNWDCVVYNPKKNRFQLWYQEAHAD